MAQNDMQASQHTPIAGREQSQHVTSHYNAPTQSMVRPDQQFAGNNGQVTPVGHSPARHSHLFGDHITPTSAHVNGHGLQPVNLLSIFSHDTYHDSLLLPPNWAPMPEISPMNSSSWGSIGPIGIFTLCNPAHSSVAAGSIMHSTHAFGASNIATSQHSSIRLTHSGQTSSTSSNIQTQAHNSSGTPSAYQAGPSTNKNSNSNSNSNSRITRMTDEGSSADSNLDAPSSPTTSATTENVLMPLYTLKKSHGIIDYWRCTKQFHTGTLDNPLVWFLPPTFCPVAWYLEMFGVHIVKKHAPEPSDEVVL